jgi:hypothetical protein
MLLRSIVLSGCAIALAGCHTINAVQQLAGPSPVTAVAVEPSEDRVTWLAEYREPPDERDPVLHGIFVRGVTKRGRMDVDPDSSCVAAVEGDGGSAGPLRSRVSLLEPPVSIHAHAPESPISPACESQLGLRLAGAAPYPEAQAIVVRSPSAELLLEVAFPTERPARDPRRWGWLMVAPVLDGVTIALAIPYAGVVALFESLIVAIGPLKLTDIGLPVVVLTTTDEDGDSKDRALARMEIEGHLFVSANHWPRGWYRRALERPNVQVTVDDTKADYLAVPATEEENKRLNVEYPMPVAARFLTGFPPRSFLRLDPR